jgi:PAS domain S-box-containing protein
MRQSPARSKRRFSTDGVTIPGNAINGSIRTGAPANGQGLTDLAALLEDTCAELHASLRYNGRLEALRTADNCTLCSDKAIVVQLIVREAVTNAIKYSHPTGIPGWITVTCGLAHEGGVAIEITDDGVGLPEGFDPATDGDTGFRVMRALSQRLNAPLAFKSTSLGLRLSLRVPLEAEQTTHGNAANGSVAGGLRTSGKREASDPRLDRLLHDRATFRQLLDALPAAVYTTDADGHITFYNEAAANLWGCRPELGRSEFCGSWKLYHSDGRPLPHDQCPMALALKEGRKIRGMEAIAERPNGERVPFVPYPTPLFDASGRITGAVNMLVDVSEHKRAERLLAQQMDSLAALYRFTDRLFRAGSFDDVFDAALDAIGQALGCQRASILLLDDAGIMRFAAWRGLSDAYRQAVEGHSPWGPETSDPPPVCIEDIQGADLAESLKATVAGEGITALAFIPLVLKGKIIGKFMTYYDARHVFNESEIDLALAIARQLGFSVERMREEDARHRAEEELSDFFENAPVALHRLSQDGRILKANSRELEMLGYSEDEYLGRHISEIHVSPEAATNILKRVSDGEVLHNYEARLRRKDGSVRDVLIASSVLWDKGRFVHTRCFTRDITELKEADHAGRLLASIVETSEDAIVSKDLTGVVTSWNRGAERIFGYTADEMIGRSITTLIPPDRHNEEPEILERVRRGERVDHYETVRRRKDGTLVDISLTVSPVKDAAGKVVGASKIARDISEKKQAQARHQLLTQEIQHRTKNLFAVVQAIVSRSFVGKNTVADAKAAVISRLGSLGQTHAMLIDKDWEGADLAEIVRAEMSPYAGRVQVEGPSLMLTARPAQNFALALHELATNAAKYGALSNATGRVRISWSKSVSNGSDLFTFRWQEDGGPPVSPPRHKGFGSAVLEQVMAEHFEVAPHIDFLPSGARYELNGSLDALTTAEPASHRETRQ